MMNVNSSGVFWKIVVPVLVAGIACLVFLYIWNPSDISWFPRCPFLALTGLKCPGCGTLRGIHALLHFRFADAWQLNPFMVSMIPVVVMLLLSPRFRRSVWTARVVLVATVVWWIVRNLG